MRWKEEIMCIISDMSHFDNELTIHVFIFYTDFDFGTFDHFLCTVG